ncbi:MAG: 2Fe-2S iron-sulfur cluster binding domain-containing protein [Chlorobiaceae bacterium]|nr:2Fe-2S iron-sulfur cluster binding domain-containing protein [Chlorobiaceae bacterium]
MNLIINDKSCSSAVGQTVGKAARLNHSHVGYVCGGHGVCNACYVTVQDGADCLAPLTDIEKASLSSRQIAAGGRMACQATIAREGTVKVLSRPEEVRRTLFSNPLELFAYGAQMGQDTIRQIVPALQLYIGRITRNDLGCKEWPDDLKESVSGAIGFAMEALPQMIPFREQVMGIVSNLPVQLPSQLPFKLPFEFPFQLPFAPSKPPETLERVTITVAPPKA